MRRFVGLVITFALGIFVLIGAAIAGFAKSGHRVGELSVSVALGAIAVLLVADLLPETLEGVGHLGWPWTIAGVIAGFVILLLLDRFLPESHEAHGEGHSHGHEHGSALHISIAVVIALTVHNVIEGMSVYGVAVESTSAALMLAFGIGIHNLPMGMIVYSGVRDQSLARRVGILAVAALSTFAGGLVMCALGTGANDLVVHFMIALTVGLLLYIVIMELVPSVIRTHDRKLAVVGIIAGAAIVFVGVFFAGSGHAH